MSVLDSRSVAAVSKQGNLVRVRDRSWLVKSVVKALEMPRAAMLIADDVGLRQHHRGRTGHRPRRSLGRRP